MALLQGLDYQQHLEITTDQAHPLPCTKEYLSYEYQYLFNQKNKKGQVV